MSGITDITLSQMTNFDMQRQLSHLAIRAIVAFKFPKISLEYSFDETLNEDTMEAYGFYFIEDGVGQKEFNVILARMKQYWIEYQISQERVFENVYYDRDIRVHSPSAMIEKLVKLLSTFRGMADKEEYDYGRITAAGRPKIGEINV